MPSGHYRSLLVSIQAFTGGPLAGRFYRFEHIVAYSSFKALSKQRPTATFSLIPPPVIRVLDQSPIYNRFSSS